MQDEWEFCRGLHLHPGGRPLFNPGCRCKNDWACSYYAQNLPDHWDEHAHTYWWQWTMFARSLPPTTSICGGPIRWWWYKRWILKEQAWMKSLFVYMAPTYTKSFQRRSLALFKSQVVQWSSGVSLITRASHSKRQTWCIPFKILERNLPFQTFGLARKPIRIGGSGPPP